MRRPMWSMRSSVPWQTGCAALSAPASGLLLQGPVARSQPGDGPAHSPFHADGFRPPQLLLPGLIELSNDLLCFLQSHVEQSEARGPSGHGASQATVDGGPGRVPEAPVAVLAPCAKLPHGQGLTFSLSMASSLPGANKMRSCRLDTEAARLDRAESEHEGLMPARASVTVERVSGAGLSGAPPRLWLLFSRSDMSARGREGRVAEPTGGERRETKLGNSGR